MVNELAQYATTDRQKQILDAVAREGSNAKAAKFLGCHRRTVDKAMETP